MDKKSSDKPVILFVDHAATLGGAEHSLLLLLQHLGKMACQPQLACPTGDLAKNAAQLGIPWHLATLPRLRRSSRFLSDWVERAQQLAHTARQIDAAALYANTVRAALYTMLAAKMIRRPFIWHMRDFWLSESEPDHRKIDWAMKSLLCRAAVRVITNSAATAQHLPHSKKITIIHNGIDLKHFQTTPEGYHFRQQFNIPVDSPLVGTVGRLRSWKGQEQFIHMAARLATAHLQTHFVIVGGSPFAVKDDYPERLRQLATTYNLTSRLHFTGHLNDVRPALAALDIFIHAGKPEPFGLVNVEAMAMERPIVAFAHGALPEIVVPEETGILVQPGDVAALAKAVTELLQSGEQRRQLGQAGRQRVSELFTIQKTADRVASILHQVLGTM